MNRLSCDHCGADHQELREETATSAKVTCAACFPGTPLHQQKVAFADLPLAQEKTE